MTRELKLLLVICRTLLEFLAHGGRELRNMICEQNAPEDDDFEE